MWSRGEALLPGGARDHGRDRHPGGADIWHGQEGDGATTANGVLETVVIENILDNAHHVLARRQHDHRDAWRDGTRQSSCGVDDQGPGIGTRGEARVTFSTTYFSLRPDDETSEGDDDDAVTDSTPTPTAKAVPGLGLWIMCGDAMSRAWAACDGRFNGGGRA